MVDWEGIFGNSPFDDPNLIEFDEIRFGTSFRYVAPRQVQVPEPALGFVLLICLPGLFALKR